MSEKEQNALFEKIAGQYRAHYSDACSRKYRRKFVDDPMFAGMTLSGKRVIEAMCGGGETTEYLLSRGAHVTGVDISMRNVGMFRRRWPQCSARCVSIFQSGLETGVYDCVVVVGGLHHLQPRVDDAVREFHRILKPGGYFCFSEPHRGSFFDLVRRVWYRHDIFFAPNEQAVDLRALKREFSTRFQFIREEYMGNIAYLLVLNSLIFRVPLRWKPLYTPGLLKLETAINRFQGKRSSCFVVNQWRKN